mgnify:CR=1 FL=1
MADKPKYQHELADRLASITRYLSLEFVDSQEEQENEPDLKDLPPALLYLRAFWETICREWRGIDRLRLNKFYYLMKQFMTTGFDLLKSVEFDRDFTCVYFGIIQEFPLNVFNQKIPSAIKIHFIENYVIGIRNLGILLDEGLTIILLSPLFEALSKVEDKAVLRSLEEVFMNIIATHSEEDNSDEEEDDAKSEEDTDATEDALDLGLFTETLFSMGADPEVKDANRKVLYKLSELYKPFESDPSPCSEGCACSDEHDDE